LSGITSLKVAPSTSAESFNTQLLIWTRHNWHESPLGWDINVCLVFGQCHLKRSLRSLQITCSLLLVSGPLRNNILPREDRP
jgi:hypothetical protein